jgi:hypothetical protein
MYPIIIIVIKGIKILRFYFKEYTICYQNTKIILFYRILVLKYLNFKKKFAYKKHKILIERFDACFDLLWK